jgi:hypothetical protein
LGDGNYLIISVALGSSFIVQLHGPLDATRGDSGGDEPIITGTVEIRVILVAIGGQKLNLNAVLQFYPVSVLQTVLALPNTGHTPEDSGDKGQQVGQDEHRMRLGKQELIDHVALPAHHDLVHV